MLINNEFQVLQKLGEGAYSSVYKVLRVTDHTEFALKQVKIVAMKKHEKNNALNEIRLLSSIRHPNIMCYKDSFIDEETETIGIVMELADQGDLQEKIRSYMKRGEPMPEKEIWTIFIQCIKGLKALHDRKIMHRDLKTANIFMFKNNVAKLGDLNVSKIAKNGMLKTQTGTPFYSSPEIWRGSSYDFKTDIWSMGCILYEMATYKPPFIAEDHTDLMKMVMRGHYKDIPKEYSPELRNVIRALLQFSHIVRPNCDQILNYPQVKRHMDEFCRMEPTEEELNHEFYQTIRYPEDFNELQGLLPPANYKPMEILTLEKPAKYQYQKQTKTGIQSFIDALIMGTGEHRVTEVDPNEEKAVNTTTTTEMEYNSAKAKRARAAREQVKVEKEEIVGPVRRKAHAWDDKGKDIQRKSLIVEEVKMDKSATLVPKSTRHARQNTEVSINNNSITPTAVNSRRIRIPNIDTNDSMITQRRGSLGVNSTRFPLITPRNVSPRPGVFTNKEDLAEMNYLVRPGLERNPNKYVLRALGAFDPPPHEGAAKRIEAISKEYVKQNDLEAKSKYGIERVLVNGASVIKSNFNTEQLKTKKLDFEEAVDYDHAGVMMELKMRKHYRRRGIPLEAD